MSGSAYIEITQGNNYPPVVWEFLDEDDNLIDLSGSVMRLRIVWPRNGPAQIDRRSDSDPSLVLDGPAGRLTWNYTTSDSRQIPLGDGVAIYEIERWVGTTQQTILRDKVICSRGDNSDNGTPS